MVIAFIPVRGGSKSIPLKNIKSFCGKPLVYWSLFALQKATSVDEVIVATDSPAIEKAVSKFHFSKVKLYKRSAENAVDTASSESVMLEYLNKNNLSNKDCFMLVQATSPLTESHHFEEALALYRTGKFDSILTCVRNYRFYWRKNGTSLNYDYQKRPRRQEFDGMLMENGAFYINSVENILRDKNRLSGKIGLYEMPEYTSFEIDEPDDWSIMEALMKRHILNRDHSKIPKIKLVLTDVDGVLTDGGMYYSENGDEWKKFNTRDGMGFQILREAGIKTGIITSENTEIVKRRATKVKADFLMQGKWGGGKLTAVEDICNELGVDLTETAYIGDDINDLALLSAVGLAACPADAGTEIKSIFGIRVLSAKGGGGAFREFVDFICRQ